MSASDLWGDAALSDLRALSDETLVDTCTLYPFNGQFNGQPVMSNRGGVSQTFLTAIPNIPCRMDVDTRSLVPQRAKEGIDAQKILRYLYISRQYLIDNNFAPKIKDEIETTAGEFLGRVVRYRILDINYESEEVDCQLLVEVAT